MDKSPFSSPKRLAHTKFEDIWTKRILWAVGMLLAFIAISTVGFRLIDSQYSWLDALYMTIITISSVGYREVHSPNFATKLWGIFVIIGGLITATVAMSIIVAIVVEGQIRTVFGRRKLERKIAGLNGHIILCGFGRMGQLVAAELESSSQSIVVVDNDTARTEVAGSANILYVLGDALEEAVLADAGISRANVLVAALPSDADNVFLTLTAHAMKSDLRIIALAREAGTTDKLSKAGATRVVCPYLLGASKMAAVVLRPAVVDFVEVAGRGIEIAMDQVVLDSHSNLVGKTLKELELPKRAGVQVCAVQRNGDIVYQPDPEFCLAAEDVLVLVGKRGSAEAVENM